MAGAELVSLGELLKRYRIAAGLTQEELAERAGLSARAIRALESGAHRAPRRDTLALLASALELTSAERARLEARARQPRLPASRRAVFPSAERRPRPPLIGRQAERALLNDLLIGEGSPLLLFAGEPGIGKSRLLEEAADQASELGWVVLAGGCHRRSGQEPYAPWMSILTRFLASRSLERQRHDLQGCAWLVKLLPELGDRMLVPAPAWALPPEQERRLMFAAVARFVANVAGPAGTLVILDDLQWAGVDALDLLAFLVREGAGRSVRIVGAYRDTDVSTRDPLPVLLADLTREGLAASTLLAPLARDEAEQLLAQLLASAPDIAPDAWRDILGRAGGLPFFLVSCAQEARLGALLNADMTSSQRFSLPWSAAESIRQRVALLPEPAQEMLAVAAIAGRHALRRVIFLVAERLGHDEGATLRALEALTHARLLAESEGDGYVFTHDLIRETVEAGLSGARRTALSLRVAEASERLPQPERRAAELAWQFACGGDPARALPHALRAGDQAEAVFAHSQAERHFRAAAEWAHQLGDGEREGVALEKLADILYHLGRFAEAYDCLDQTIRIYQASGDWDRLVWATAQIARAGDPLGRVASSMIRLEGLFTALAAVAGSQNVGGESHSIAAATLVDRVERAASLLTPRTAARIYLCLTTRYLFLSRYDEVYAPSERAIQYAHVAEDLRIESLAFAFRSQAQRAQGHMEEFSMSVTLAHERALASGDLEALYIGLGGIADLYELRAEPRLARNSYARMLETTSQLGDVNYVIDALCNLAYFDIVLGEWDEAANHLERAIALEGVSEPGAWSSPVIGTALLGSLRAKRGRVPSEALAHAGSAVDDRISAWAIATLAEMEILDGAADTTADRLRHVIEQAPNGSLYGCYLYPALALADSELGVFPGALEILARGRELAGAEQNRMALVDIERIAAVLAVREGRWEDARGALEQSLAISREAPYPYAEAKARYVYGQLHAATGAQTLAREEYERALAICARLGERPYQARIEKALKDLPGAEATGH